MDPRAEAWPVKLAQQPHPLTERRWCYLCERITAGTWTPDPWAYRCDRCGTDTHLYAGPMIGDPR